MGEKNLHQLVFQAAKEILENGEYPTINLICDKLGLNPGEIKKALKVTTDEQTQPSSQTTEQEMLDTLTILTSLSEDEPTDSQVTETDPDSCTAQTETNLLGEKVIPDRVSEMAARAERKAQYMAAAELVLTQKLYRYYRNTEDFSQPEVKQEVEKAMAETAQDWEDDLQNFSPAVILKKYGK